MGYTAAMKKRAVLTDVGLAATGRAADGARLWLLVAAALACDGRFGRRAAARGLLSLGIAEAVANGAVKPLVRARRPRPRRAALLTRGRPSTSSFPSAHSAAAAAFAVGAGSELPPLAVPLGATAGLVAWSRVRTGRHHPRDVVAGLALGTAVAAATRRVWPVAPHEPAATRSALTRSGGAGRPGGAGITIVVNQASGPALGRDRVDLLREGLPDAEIVTVEDPDGVQAALEDAARRAEVLGVCGGDGTVNAAACIAHAARKPLLVVPGGTLNHFAMALGLETVDDAVEAATKGELAAVDVGCIADRPFLNAASLGVYVDLVAAREQLEGVIGKWPAVVVALVRVLLRAEPLELEIDGERRRVWMAFFGNCRYHPAGFAPSWRERLDDGDLDVRLVEAGGWSRLRLVLAVLTGRLGRSRVYESRTASRVEVRSLGGPVGLAADGEVLDGPETFTVEKLDRSLQVLTRTE